MLGWAAGFLIKFLSSGLLEKVVGYLKQRTDAQVMMHGQDTTAATQIVMAQLHAEIENRKLQAQIIQADRGWWVTAWIRPLFVYPIIIHFWLIVYDSLPLFGHVPGSLSIPALPSPFNEYEGYIILSFFIARPIEKIGRAVIGKVWK